MPSGYGPLFGGSAVLPDGRVIFEGGEYNDSSQSGTCPAIRRPAPVSAPSTIPSTNSLDERASAAELDHFCDFRCSAIGDAAGIVLDNGTYMQSNCCYTVSSA